MGLQMSQTTNLKELKKMENLNKYAAALAVVAVGAAAYLYFTNSQTDVTTTSQTIETTTEAVPAVTSPEPVEVGDSVASEPSSEGGTETNPSDNTATEGTEETESTNTDNSVNTENSGTKTVLPPEIIKEK